jgi:hypothetical protein
MNNPMKVSSINCTFKHYISTMVICGSYMFEFSVSKDMKEKDIIREVAVGKVAAHLCLTLIVKELRIIVEQGRVVTTLNIIKH